MHTTIMPSHGTFLLLAALCSIIVLIVLIARYKVNPFIALMTVSIALAIATGMPMQTVVHSFEAGVGGTLGHIAIVIGLGTMLGKMMAESGGADQIAFTLIRVFGEKRVHWAMVVIGFVVGLPVFFEVGFVLLIPIAFIVAKRTRTSLILVGIPMVAGLSVVHGLVPPHPAALLAVAAYHADVGKTVFYALIVGIPTAILAGPLYAKIIAPHIHLDSENPMAALFLERDPKAKLPSFSLTMATVLFPVILMMIGSFANTFAPRHTLANQILRLVGGADIALLIGALVSFVTLGTMRGFNRDTILKFSNECLAPTASITLLIGAGGGFGRILQDSGTAQAIVDIALRAHIPVLLLAWLVAAAVRVATGSATVAMTTAAGIIAPIALHAPGAQPELLALATGAGSLVFSHVNDGGFWLVKEYFNMTVGETFKTWTVCETIISVVALLFTVALSRIV
ncbi:MAG: gluconate:H+ symporter [Acidobacteriaceae bacterium]